MLRASLISLRRVPKKSIQCTPLLAHRYHSKISEAKLDRESRRNPELYVLFLWMASGFALVGWNHWGMPTSSISAQNVRIAEMPWEIDEADVSDRNLFKYRYHPHGDISEPAKNAPSALNEVVLPEVTLPKSLHKQFNKYGQNDH